MGRESVDGTKKDDKLENFLLAIWVACFMAPIILFFGMRWWFGSAMPKEMSDWGVFGDFVGGLSNPFISAMTFLGLILTIMQNQKVLRLNEAELRETRKEIELTREANEKQAAEFSAQNEHMQNRAKVDSMTQALLQLSSRMREEWTTKNSYRMAPVTACRKSSHEVRQAITDKSSPLWIHFSCIKAFLPLAVSYIKLVLALEEQSPDNPMVRSLITLNADILRPLLENDYLDSDLNNSELLSVSHLLAKYYSVEFEETSYLYDTTVNEIKA